MGKLTKKSDDQHAGAPSPDSPAQQRITYTPMQLLQLRNSPLSQRKMDNLPPELQTHSQEEPKNNRAALPRMKK